MHDRKVLADDVPQVARERQVVAREFEIMKAADERTTVAAEHPGWWATETPDHVVVEARKAKYRAVLPPAAAKLRQVVDFFFMLLYVALGLRLALELLGARPDATFTVWVTRISEPLMAPFRGLLPAVDPRVADVVPLLVAFFVFALAQLLILRMLWLFAHRRATV